MRTSIIVLIIVLVAITPIAILIYIYGAQVNAFLEYPIADRLLLIVLIIVDGLGGVLAPFLSIKPSKEKMKSKS